jgi:sulfur dioxygenase
VYSSNAKVSAWVGSIIDYYREKNHNNNQSLIFRQYYEPVSSTYTYLLADKQSKEAILIDPVFETATRDLQQIQDLGLTLKYCLNTHVHADHITGTALLKEKVPGCQSVIAAVSGAKADVLLKEFDSVNFGKRKIYFVATPGHTNVRRTIYTSFVHLY